MARTSTGTVCVDGHIDLPQNSLDRLYTDYRERLFRFVLPRVRNDRDVAEDVVQEAFAAALIALSGFKARSSAYTWLCSIAQHKIADYYRREWPQDSSRAADCESELAKNLEDGEQLSTVESCCEAQETSDLILRALEKLPRDYERVLRRKYFAGLSTVELSAELGRTPKAVEGLLARARRALSTQLSSMPS